MDELLGNLTHSPYHIYKNGIIYQIEYSSVEDLQPRGTHGFNYIFKVIEIDDDAQLPKYKKVFISSIFNAELRGTRSASLLFQIIAGRAIYEIIDKEQIETGIDSANHQIYLYKDRRDKQSVRNAIIDYMTKRYKELHNKPFLIYEIVSALKYNYKTVLNQIDRLIREDVLNCSFKNHPLNKPFDTLPEEEQIRHRVTKGPKFKSENNVQSNDIDAHFGRVDVEHKGNYIFLIMPFKESEYPQYVYKDIIKPLCKDILDCDCIRVDDDKLSRDMLDKIYTYTSDCKFLIADISTHNPNVLYELGMAHTLKKDVIILFDESKFDKSKSGKKRPFDLDHIRFTEYSNDDELKEELSEALKSHGKKHNLI